MIQFEAKMGSESGDKWEPVAIEWLGFRTLQLLSGGTYTPDFAVCSFRRGVLVPGGAKGAERVWVRIAKGGAQ